MINDEDIKSKLLILFILEKLEMPINEDILLQMCSLDNDWIPYLCFSQYMNELSGAGFINRHLDENTKRDYVLSLSEDGKVCLSHFFKDIYKSVRDDVTNYIRTNKLMYRKKQEFSCNYSRLTDGTFKVTCAVLNVDAPVFEMTFNVPTVAKAIAIRNKWQNKAPDFYRAYTDLLID